MKVLGIAGWSGSGKTTLVVRLVPALIARGITVSTIKHAHHGFDVDRPGKDSWRHREAGATEVLVSSARRWALLHEHRDAAEASLDELIARMSPVDLLLVEGFKHYPHDKIEVWREAVRKPLLARDDRRVIAIAADVPPGGVSVPILNLDDVAAIADFILDHCGLVASPA
jgi:molybdopterin-guanine dinucleotide biosynthesis protein B